jgi:transmembrane sensor
MNVELVEKYLNDDCTAEEAAQVLAWLATPKGQAYLKICLEQDLKMELTPQVELDSASVFSKIKEQLESLPPKETMMSRTLWYRWAAAVVGILMVVGAGYWYFLPQDLIVKTDFGMTKTIVLPDKSVVTLNGNSEIKYRKQWVSNETREVWVKGEAFFKVTHQANHERFVVHLPRKYDVEVLGTEFGIYARQHKTRVVLNTGKIRLRVAEKAENMLDMKPGDMFEADANAKRYVAKKVNPETYSSWRKSVLTFEETSLSEIIQRLEEIYGVEVIVTEKALLQQQFSGSLPSQNMDVLLDGLEKLFDLKVTRTKREIIIESKDN